MRSLKERIARLSAERLKRTEKGQIALTERQIRIIEFINQNGKITNRDVKEMFKTSSQAAHKELNKIVQLDVIKPIGKGRSLAYQVKLVDD